MIKYLTDRYLGAFMIVIILTSSWFGMENGLLFTGLIFAMVIGFDLFIIPFVERVINRSKPIKSTLKRNS